MYLLLTKIIVNVRPTPVENGITRSGHAKMESKSQGNEPVSMEKDDFPHNDLLERESQRLSLMNAVRLSSNVRKTRSLDVMPKNNKRNDFNIPDRALTGKYINNNDNLLTLLKGDNDLNKEFDFEMEINLANPRIKVKNKNTEPNKNKKDPQTPSTKSEKDVQEAIHIGIVDIHDHPIGMGYGSESRRVSQTDQMIPSDENIVPPRYIRIWINCPNLDTLANSAHHIIFSRNLLGSENETAIVKYIKETLGASRIKSYSDQSHNEMIKKTEYHNAVKELSEKISGNMKLLEPTPKSQKQEPPNDNKEEKNGIPQPNYPYRLVLNTNKKTTEDPNKLGSSFQVDAFIFYSKPDHINLAFKRFDSQYKISLSLNGFSEYLKHAINSIKEQLTDNNQSNDYLTAEEAVYMINNLMSKKCEKSNKAFLLEAKKEVMFFANKNYCNNKQIHVHILFIKNINERKECSVLSIKNAKEHENIAFLWKERKRMQECCVLLKRTFAQPCYKV